MVTYQRVNVLIGRPHWVRPIQKEQYQGRQAKKMVTELTEQCHAEIDKLLHQGSY